MGPDTAAFWCPALFWVKNKDYGQHLAEWLMAEEIMFCSHTFLLSASLRTRKHWAGFGSLCPVVCEPWLGEGGLSWPSSVQSRQELVLGSGGQGSGWGKDSQASASLGVIPTLWALGSAPLQGLIAHLHFGAVVSVVCQFVAKYRKVMVGRKGVSMRLHTVLGINLSIDFWKLLSNIKIFSVLNSHLISRRKFNRSIVQQQKNFL